MSLIIILIDSQIHRRSPITQYSISYFLSWVDSPVWYFCRHRAYPPAIHSALLHGYHPSMLWRPLCISEYRRCICGNHHRGRCLNCLVSLVPWAFLVIINTLKQNRYVMMWPWRVQTTQGATGSAFAIAFANSYGQIGGAVGSQLFNSRYAPRYTTSFGIAMGFVGMAIIMNLVTWGFTWKVDVDTRRLKRIRVAAAKQNQAVLDDVDISAGRRQEK